MESVDYARLADDKDDAPAAKQLSLGDQSNFELL